MNDITDGQTPDNTLRLICHPNYGFGVKCAGCKYAEEPVLLSLNGKNLTSDYLDVLFEGAGDSIVEVLVPDCDLRQKLTKKGPDTYFLESYIGGQQAGSFPGMQY